MTCYHCFPPTLSVIKNIIIWFKIIKYNNNNNKCVLSFYHSSKAIGGYSHMMLVAIWTSKHKYQFKYLIIYAHLNFVSEILQSTL
jgi:hypothetical protein